VLAEIGKLCQHVLDHRLQRIAGALALPAQLMLAGARGSQQFGRPIIHNQAISFTLANMKTVPQLFDEIERRLGQQPEGVRRQLRA
jgi:alkylation response protein AidB-like acyl-CoA dehydrogenase